MIEPLTSCNVLHSVRRKGGDNKDPVFGAPLLGGVTLQAT